MSLSLSLSAVEVKVIKSYRHTPWQIFEHPVVIALQTTACCLSRLSFSDRKTCSGSQSVQLLVQQVLLVACCFAQRTEHQHLKLTCFATPRGPLTVSITVALVCCTACKLNTCQQLCFSVKALLCSAAPHERCNGFQWRTIRQ